MPTVLLFGTQQQRYVWHCDFSSCFNKTKFHEEIATLSTLQSTESPATGHVYGSVDRWIGLGLFFDSFDNDNKHNNPYIMAMTNDGTKNFDHRVQLEMRS